MDQRQAIGVVLAALATLGVACKPDSSTPPSGAITADTHQWFPITVGSKHELGRTTPDGPITCESCHTASANGIGQFDCLGCHSHEQTVTDMVHQSVKTDYSYTSSACYSCHMTDSQTAFSHTGITGNCASCHDVGNPFAALPIAGFTHPNTNGADCGGCHTTASWKGAGGSAPKDSFDPARDVMVDALVPTFAGTSIASLSAQTEVLPQMMNHATAALDPSVLSSCTTCHDTGAGLYYPGTMHASLDVAKMAQPTACGDCHAATMPTGFVGPIAASGRTPPSGEMKHDAVLWNNGAPSMTMAVSGECGTCHLTPGHVSTDWTVGTDGMSPVRFHASLTAAGAPQPTSCLDCHANSRPCPGGDCSATLTAAAFPGLPANVQFDHTSTAAMGDCASCHSNASAMNGTSWAGAKFHPPGSATPKTCLPCHASERPTSTTGWMSATYTKSPFDYVTNSTAVTHGDGQDCASCHTGPGTGAWGVNPNWAGGSFPHGAGTVAATTCIACHESQRPTAPVSGFDHSLNGKSDCFGCHQATVTAGKYVNYNNPSTGTLPGGDWQGGQTYPGSVLASGGDKSITVTEISLSRSGTANLVTGMTTTSATLYNGIVHTSSAIDSRVAPGSAANPDNTKCWHCHTNTNGTVTAYAGGKFHAALMTYAATPGGAVTAIPQPTGRCNDCHAQMRPAGIVEQASSDLQPMDHAAEFTAAVTIGGASVTSVSQLDCSTCHMNPGGAWSGGKFHANIGQAVPKDCTACHYPVMADAARADLTSGALYAMKHRSGQITFQACQTCHTGALGKSTMATITATSWATGAFHPSVTAQPSACSDCHGVSEPAANKSTQSSVKYTLPAGSTSTNQGQWMNHGASYVAGKDCAACHLGDAKASGSAWSKSIVFHALVTNATACSTCHGVGNGGGTTSGTNNNLPSGLTSSTTTTSAASDASTGVAAGTKDQIDHSDVNVTGHDCNFCHTQVGPSTASGVAGKEWAQAKFHASFNSANALVTNGTTGRCSNCHVNVKPASSFSPSHDAYTNASGSTDCSSCHSWPGAGGTASPNWLGATGGVPTVISVGGFIISKPPAANTTTTQAGISNLPHPTVGSQACTACHTSSGGGRKAIGYDHGSTLENAACNACHEAGSDLVNPVWNGSTSQSSGAGDSRPFTISSLKATKGGSSCTVTYANHFYPADCSQCHPKPTGTVKTTTGSTYTSAWTFNHNESKMKGLCNDCHGPCPGD